MPPSSALQSRIRQFEALDASISTKKTADRFPPARKPVVLHSPPAPPANPLEDPISPAAAAFSTIKPNLPYAPRKPPKPRSASPSPPNLGCKTSLIDLKDWLDDEPDAPQATSRNDQSENKLTPRSIAPPLPPRNPSKNGGSRASSISPKPPSPSRNFTSVASNSLTVDHTYPPRSQLSPANIRQGQGHIHAASTSSFHSVSLSSDGGNSGPGSISNFVSNYPMDQKETENDRDRDSVEDSFSFETVSSTAVSSPSQSSTHEWEKDMTFQKVEPPKLPERSRPRISMTTAAPSSATPPSSRTSPAPALFSSQASSRRPPPPPPTRTRIPSHRASVASTATSSDHSSLFSTTTATTTHTSSSTHNSLPLFRPTPVPPIARKRYEMLFLANVIAGQQSGNANLSPVPHISDSWVSSSTAFSPRKGWRGLSVDLITNPAEHNDVHSEKSEAKQAEDGIETRIDGQIVKLIWNKSRLGKQKLRHIWIECAVPGEGFLDQEGFIKGMWRIDEELRRAQNARESIARSRLRPSTRTTIDSLLH